MWTTTALASEFRRYKGEAWRIVEAQHRISTNRLADSLTDQTRLEQLAEAAKPDLPGSARGLHYLLASPFRYGHKMPSRFRRAGERPGIFYASEHEATAIAETAYWRLRFFARAKGFVPGSTTTQYSSFSVPLKAMRMIDLSKTPFAVDAAKWADPLDYTACQTLATTARAAAAQLIRTMSVRDPEHRANLVVLDPATFAAHAPTPRQSWHFRYENGQLTALAAFPAQDRHVFTASQFGLAV
jgi:hypothetical protein